MLSNLFRLWYLFKEVLAVQEKATVSFRGHIPQVELILHVFNAAILSWRAVACGMRSGTTTGFTGR